MQNYRDVHCGVSFLLSIVNKIIRNGNSFKNIIENYMYASKWS